MKHPFHTFVKEEHAGKPQCSTIEGFAFTQVDTYNKAQSGQVQTYVREGAKLTIM